MNNYEKIYQQILGKDITIKKRSLSFTKFSNNNDKLSIKEKQNINDEKKIGNYILGKKLGQGTFGIVVLAKHEITGENVAIKILDKEKIVRESDKTRLEREIRIMKNMYHNNIVQLYQVIENQKELFIVMEYISGKELFDYIIHKKHLDDLESCKFYQQIISGIEYLGQTKVAHRDLKPENLLLDSKKNIKIVDFGLSNTYFQDELLTTACGSPCYAAPEMLSGEKYNGVNIDIWSSGIVLYAMLCGYLPFEDNNNPKLYKKIIKGEFETPDFLSPYAIDLLHRILNVDPEKRYTIEQIKEHPWFNQINPKLNMSKGLLIDYYIVPFDEDIICQMVNEYSYNEQQIKAYLLTNKHNHITVTYYLMLKKKIRNGKKTIGDMTSQLFIDYINDERNLKSSYDFDLNSIIIDRVLNKNKNKLNSTKNVNKFELRQKENMNESQFKYYENNVSKININPKNQKNKSNINGKEYNTVNTGNKDKFFETLATDKNSSGKKLTIREGKINIKSKNLMSLYETKNQIYKKRDNIKNNYNRKTFKSNRENNNININNNIYKNKTSKKYSTLTENNVKNISQRNDNILMDNNKKIINRISFLKESIINTLTNKNKENKNIDNLKEINNNSNLSPEQTHYFSNKNFFTKIKPNLSNKKYNNNNEFKYTKIDTSELIKDKNITSSKERYKKLNVPTTPFMDKNRHKGQHEIIKIIQRIKNKTKDANTNTMIENVTNNGIILPSRNNFTKTNFYINNASRVSRTPNNIGRNITNKIIFEQNINNDLNKKIYEIKFLDNRNNLNNLYKNEKKNNIINNNNNNINIHINLTNIYKNIRPDQQIQYNKDVSLFNDNKNKSKLLENNKKMNNNIKNINEIMRENKFIDNNLKHRKYFIDTSVSLEKKNEEKGRRRQIESENKENRFLVNKMSKKNAIINNFNNNNITITKPHDIKKITIKRDNEESSVQRKEKDNRYLKIKSKNKKFNEFKFNKMHSLNENKMKNEKFEFNNIINNISIERTNLIRIKKKNTISNKNFNDNIVDKNINHMSINYPSFYNISNNNSNIKIYNSNNKSFPKKAIFNTKQIFNSINTEFYHNNNENLTTTDFNFFSAKNNNNITNDNFYRDKILKKAQDFKNILSERITKNRNTNIIKKKNDFKKTNFMKPFDLNSIIYTKNETHIKETINNILKSKNITFNENNNKYTCYKKELKFDFNIIDINELDGAFLIKSFQKPVNSIKIKKLYYNMILKLINNIK